jgi:hypothetical protein
MEAEGVHAHTGSTSSHQACDNTRRRGHGVDQGRRNCRIILARKLQQGNRIPQDGSHLVPEALWRVAVARSRPAAKPHDSPAGGPRPKFGPPPPSFLLVLTRGPKDGEHESRLQPPEGGHRIPQDVQHAQHVVFSRRPAMWQQRQVLRKIDRGRGGILNICPACDLRFICERFKDPRPRRPQV